MARPLLNRVTPPLYQPGAGRSRLSALAVSFRPEQWTKNLLVFAGLLFGGRLLDPAAALAAAWTFVLFCALSAAVYIFNDLRDADADRRHPVKRTRPIAAGELQASTALVAVAALVMGAVAGAFLVTPLLAGVAGAYAALLLLYSL